MTNQVEVNTRQRCSPLFVCVHPLTPPYERFYIRWFPGLSAVHTLPVPASMPVCISDWTDYPAGIACCHGIVGNILYHDTAAADNYIGTDGDTRHHLDTSTYPHIVAHGDRIGILQSFVAPFRVNRVSCRMKSAVRSYKDIVAKRDLSRIKNYKIMVRIEVFSYLITAKRKASDFKNETRFYQSKTKCELKSILRREKRHLNVNSDAFFTSHIQIKLHVLVSIEQVLRSLQIACIYMYVSKVQGD